MSTTASQQFEGTSIEEALTAAVSSLGEDLEILDAQRVRRRGVLGLRKRERFEVTAAPGAAEPKGFEDVLRRMVERVDDAERAVGGADLADTDPAWWSDADFVIPPAGDGAEPKPKRRRLRSGRSGSENAVAVDLPSTVEVDVRTPSRAAAPSEAPAVSNAEPTVFASAPAPAPEPTVVATAPTTTIEPVAPDARPVIEEDSPEWSREALLALDLPPALIGRMRCDELEDDLDWIAALARAISELLETASSMSGPCELTGHGADAAVHLVRGACDGFRLDSLIIDGRRVPATPLELALAIRSLLRVER